LDVSVSILQNDKKSPLVVAFVQDIIERKRAEKEILLLNQELEQRVKDRTSELEKSLKEVERMNELFVGREFRIKELRNEIENLKGKLNK